MRVRSAAAYTLGCKVNQCDTDALLERLETCGVEIKTFTEPADLYIINTCAVTLEAERKSRQIIRRARGANPNALAAVCGCAVKTGGVTGADIVFDARDADKLFEFLGLTDDFIIDRPLFRRRRTRAFIKVQDGCDRYCAYCVVPGARGPCVSRRFADIEAEAREHARRGVKEAVLTGIHLASYGNDLSNNDLSGGGAALPALMERLAKLGLFERIRLGSIEPYAVDGGFLRAVADYPVICPHFHLSLQSGCDATLKRMNRRYTAAEYAEAARRIRAIRPDAALTTDIIAGFPGETDGDFSETLRFMEQMRFAGAHVFEFSPRPGTPAASFPEQVPVEIKAERGGRARKLARELADGFMRERAGRTVKVLYESKRRGLWEGHTDNYITVRARSDEDLFNRTGHTALLDITADGAMLGGITAIQPL